MRLNEYMRQMELFPDDKITLRTDAGEPLTIKYSLYSKIQKECSEIIKIYDKVGKCLFRGSGYTERHQEVSNGIFKVVPRKDRKPRDTDPDLSETFDLMLYYKFGWKPRSNGVFVTGNIGVTREYGEPYLFLPTNNYKYLWSNKYRDLYVDLLEDFEDTLYSKHFESDGRWVDVDTGNKYKNFHDVEGFIRVESEDTDSNGLVTTMTISIKNPEPEFDEDEELLVNLEWETDFDIDEERQKELDKAIRTFQNNNIELAIKSKHEIMFKCDYYYMIAVSHNSGDMTIKEFGL